mgnify:FL=1
MLAAANGHRDVVHLLLAAGSNPNARDNLGGCALLEAVKGGWDELVQQLVAAGAGLQLAGCELASALCAMVLDDQPHLLRRYLAAGADANAADYDKRTPLHIAAAEGKLGMVVLLVEEGGAELGAVDRWGNTPLAEATRVGAGDVVRYLRSDGAREAAVRARQAAAERLQSSRRYGMRPSSGGCSSPQAGMGVGSAGVWTAGVWRGSPPSGGEDGEGAAAAAAAGGVGLTPLQRSMGSPGGSGGGRVSGGGEGAMGRAVSHGDAAIDEAVRYFDTQDEH